MHLVLQEEPPSPRRLVPSLPRDLETIVLKCLEKEPGRRYASARALYDDLRRYLDGEPIEARRASWLYRLRHRARKHRAVLAVAAVAAVLIAVAVGSAVAERLRARAIADAAQRFGREVESLTWIQRASHQLPLHDVRAERELLRDRMKDIKEKMAGLGSAGRGPGLYALGRGHLALGEQDPEPWLERASAEAERTIELAPRCVNAYLALSVILARRADLAWSRGEDPLPLEMRSVEVLRAVLEIDPELGFAYTNLGALLHKAAKSAVRRGEDPVPLLEESVAAHEAAFERVPDNSFAYFNLGHLMVTRALWEAGHGEDPSQWLEQAREAFGEGIERAPGLSGPWASRGETWFFEALWIESQGGDPSSALERAELGARESREISANDPDHLILAARIAAMRARLVARAGRSPAAHLSRVRAELKSARATSKEAVEARLALAELDVERVWAALASGRSVDDPVPARRAVDELLETNPELAPALGLRASLLLLEAASGAEDVEGLRREARRLLERALELDPRARLELGPMLRRAAEAG